MLRQPAADTMSRSVVALNLPREAAPRLLKRETALPAPFISRTNLVSSSPNSRVNYPDRPKSLTLYYLENGHKKSQVTVCQSPGSRYFHQEQGDRTHQSRLVSFSFFVVTLTLYHICRWLSRLSRRSGQQSHTPKVKAFHNFSPPPPPFSVISPLTARRE